MRSAVSVARVALLIAATAVPVAAQVQTGEIFGKVSDPTGAMVAGVKVTLESMALVRPRSMTTGPDGAYRFAGIPIGVYVVRFESSLFAKVERGAIGVETDFHAQVDVRLDVPGIEETVRVTAEGPVIDTASTSIAAHFNKQALEAIPSARDPWVILEQTPGVVMDRQNVGGNWSGQQSGYVSHGSARNQMWNMDGATITDMASDSSPGYYDFDSFEEIQITTGGNDASQDSGGVSINFVTKSGGNTFHGSSRIYVVDKGVQSNNITPDLQQQGAGFGNPIDNIREWGFELGGPIRKNKAWLWTAYSQSDINVDVVGFLKPGCTDPNNRDCLESDLTTLKNFNAKLTYQWSKDHKSSFLYNYGNKIRNARNAGPLNPPETTVRQTAPVSNFFFDHQWIASDRLMFDLKATHVDGGFLLDFHSPDLAQVQPTFDIVTSLNGRSGTRNDYIRPTTELRLDGTYSALGFVGGDHSVKFGLRYRSTPNETFTERGGGAVARYRNGVPSEAEIVRDGDVNLDEWEYSAYATDSYRRGRFTLNLGLRADYQDDAARRASIGANPILPDLLPAVDFGGADSGVSFFNVSPRVGLTFDLSGKGKTVLKSSFARYYGIGIDTATTLSPTGTTRLRYPWKDLNGDGVVQRNELDLTRLLFFDSNYDPAHPTSVQTPATVDPNLSNDTTDEVTVGLDQQLRRDFAVSLTYSYRHYANTAAAFRVGLLSSQFVPVNFTAACGNPGTCTQPSYGVTYWQLPFQRPVATILRNYQGANRRYNGLELVARKRFSDRWLMNASFTLQSSISRYEGGPDVDYQDPTNVAQQNGQPVGSQNARWVAKLSGMYQLPWGFSAAAFLNLRDGYPFNPTIQSPSRTGGYTQVDVYVVPFASERYETFRQLDARLDKTFNLGGKAHLIASLDGFNLTNEAIVLARNERQNASNANLVTQVLAPRILRFGLRLAF
jgi:hypothetical protein